MVGRPAEFARRSGALMERLGAVESAYDIVRYRVSHLFANVFVHTLTKAKQTAADLARARLAIQSSHGYFTRALSRYDSARGTSTTAAMVGGLAAGMNELNNVIGYRGMRFCLSFYSFTPAKLVFAFVSGRGFSQ